MRHKKNTVSLGRKSGPRKALMRSLAISILEAGAVTTTPAKAKAVRRLVERVIARGAEKTPNSIRYIEKKLGNKQAAMHVVNEIAPKYKDRNGGYTRIMNLGTRKGDGSKQVRLELV